MELVHIYFANFEIDLFAQPTPSDVSTEPEGVSKLAESALWEKKHDTQIFLRLDFQIDTRESD